MFVGPYLTYEEFEQLTGAGNITEEKFNSLLPDSTAQLHNVTNHYYRFSDIDKDNPWRREQFKRAIASQIKYFDILGATTYEQINSSPQSFSAGRTSVSNASRYNPSGENESKPLVAEDVYIHLEGTGLLYSGVHHQW